MKPTILKEEPMTMSEVKAELEKIEEREKELTFRSQRTKDYLQQFSVLEKSKVDKLYKDLEGLDIPRLRDVHLKKLIDILPATVEDVKVVLQGYTITVKDENLKKLADTINSAISSA